ncbi:helix-turn-helix domain-containing protein [Staphylococcus hominis]|nr:helix-turn-helix transcriptional regulator [Staphylococcus hominis]PTK21529.1 hypothetical protein BUZ52_08040 [Staphylococcus hominis]RIO52178.1 XRE family transcriptional regulator [Staphylococcus hominis]
MIKFNLKKVMREKNLNISQLNEITGISRNSLSLLINGKSKGVQFETLEKITRGLNIEVGDLFERNFNELKIETGDLYTRIETSTLQEGDVDPITKEFRPTGEAKVHEKKETSVIAAKYIIDGDNLEGRIPYNFYLEFNDNVSLKLNIDFKNSEFKNDTLYLTNHLYNFLNLLVSYVTFDILNKIKNTTLKKISKNFIIEDKKIRVTNDLDSEVLNIPLNDDLSMNFDYLDLEFKKSNEHSQYEIIFNDGIYLKNI